jgi:ABC-type branched-subunit amino acid transport system substrate-binding protein
LGVTSQRAKAADAHWALWETFCLDHNIDPFVRNCDDPIPIIQVFAQRYRDGRGAPNRNTVRSGTVEDAVRAVGQAFTQLGSTDIRKDAFGKLDFRLTRQFR